MSLDFEPSVLQFMRDRKFLKNTTEKTQQWYNSAFKAFLGCVTQQDYENRIIELRSRGIAAISCNSWITAVNAYQRWRVEQKLTLPGESFKLSKLKTEQKALATFSKEQVAKLVSYKAKSATMKRAQTLVAVLLDTGLRIAEALALRVEDVDLENCLIDVKLGEGRKHRKVPITQNGRTRLYLHLRQANPGDFGLEVTAQS